MSSKSIKIFLNFILGPVVFLWLSFSVWQQLRQQPDLALNLTRIVAALSGEQAWKLVTVIFLMAINWGLEARKWQLLVGSLEAIRFSKAFKATLSGVAFALNTPNRIGEYGGRVMYLRDGNRLKALSLTIAGSFSQLLVTLIFGIVGMLIMKDRLQRTLQEYVATADIFLIVSILVTIACALLYFRMHRLSGWVMAKWGDGKLSQLITVLNELSTPLLLRVLWLSLIRFLVFILQYILLMQAMGVAVNWWDGLWLVSVLFFWLAAGPTIALLELGLRWEYSMVLFGTISSNTIGIYSAATGIWLLNLVLPALAGSVLILGVRMHKD